MASFIQRLPPPQSFSTDQRLTTGASLTTGIVIVSVSEPLAVSER